MNASQQLVPLVNKIRRQLILFFFLTTFSFSSTIEESMMLKYGNYMAFSLLFLLLLIAFLVYGTLYYKKIAKNLKVELTQREEKLSEIQNIMQKIEVESLKEQHKFETEIVKLKQNIKILDDSLKEGLKSQVVSKIEEYQSKRTKHLDRVEIKV